MPVKAHATLAEAGGEPPGRAMPKGPRLAVDLQCAQGVDEPPGCPFAVWAEHCLQQACATGWADEWLQRIGTIDTSELCIRLVDIEEGQQLNATWRNKDSATNVLSFPADIVVGELAPLGDLVLCAPLVEREALEQNKLLADHYAHLCVHGVFHLLGYDHIVETEAELMEAREVAVLRELNVANPYE